MAAKRVVQGCGAYGARMAWLLKNNGVRAANAQQNKTKHALQGSYCGAAGLAVQELAETVRVSKTTFPSLSSTSIS